MGIYHVWAYSTYGRDTYIVLLGNLKRRQMFVVVDGQIIGIEVDGVA
jgi:hypothetical protein